MTMCEHLPRANNKMTVDVELLFALKVCLEKCGKNIAGL